jgi:hypothetical protein
MGRRYRSPVPFRPARWYRRASDNTRFLLSVNPSPGAVHFYETTIARDWVVRAWLLTYFDPGLTWVRSTGGLRPNGTN